MTRCLAASCNLVLTRPTLTPAVEIIGGFYQETYTGMVEIQRRLHGREGCRPLERDAMRCRRTG